MTYFVGSRVLNGLASLRNSILFLNTSLKLLKHNVACYISSVKCNFQLLLRHTVQTTHNDRKKKQFQIHIFSIKLKIRSALVNKCFNDVGRLCLHLKQWLHKFSEIIDPGPCIIISSLDSAHSSNTRTNTFCMRTLPQPITSLIDWARVYRLRASTMRLKHYLSILDSNNVNSESDRQMRCKRHQQIDIGNAVVQLQCTQHGPYYVGLITIALTGEKCLSRHYPATKYVAMSVQFVYLVHTSV